MNPFFFGVSDQQLFGIYHAPEGEEVRDGAVLLCPAFGHEYIAAHGSLQHLGSRLARAGFHVLRFDYFGSGDSAGETGEISIEHWKSDVGTAVQELIDTSGSRKVCVVGLRLGAALAALAAAEAAAAAKSKVHAMVLWEPVVRGSAYLEELRDVHQRWMGAMYLRPRKQLSGQDGPEVLGFPIPAGFQDELEGIDLTSLSMRPSEQMLIIANRRAAELEQLQRHYAQGANGVAYEVLPSHDAWMGEHWQTIALPPHDVLKRIVEWIAEAYQ